MAPDSPVTKPFEDFLVRRCFALGRRNWRPNMNPQNLTRPSFGFSKWQSDTHSQNGQPGFGWALKGKQKQPDHLGSGGAIPRVGTCLPELVPIPLSCGFSGEPIEKNDFQSVWVQPTKRHTKLKCQAYFVRPHNLCRLGPGERIGCLGFSFNMYPGYP